MDKHLWSSVAASALLLTTSYARAQSEGFAVNRFEPSERGSDWFVLESLDLRGHMRPAIGVVADWAYRPLVATDANGDVVRSIIRNQVFIDPGASLVLWERLRVAVNFPIQLFSDGNTAALAGSTFAPPANSTVVGDLRLGADVRLLGTYGEVFTGAVGFQISLPTGDRASYTSDGNVSFVPRLLIAGDVGPFVYAAKLGVTIRGLDEAFAGSHIGHDIVFGGSAGLRLLDHNLVIGPEIYGRTVVVEGAAFTEDATPVEGLLGAHYKIANTVRVGAGIGAGLTSGFGSPRNRGVLSVEWAPGIPPPLEREPEAVIPPNPTPAPPPEIAAPPVVLPPPDRDKDGVLDADDACPDTPGLTTTDPKTNGCPDLDRDKDSIPNDQDACPDTPGPADPNPKRNGCPKAFVQSGQIRILDQVKFKTGSAQILAGKDSEEVLMAVLSVLQGHPEFAGLLIEGHTDNRGSDAMNKKLSAARAASVVKWLVDHGVAASKLTSIGVGFDRPLETNDTEEGRTSNRRVEFHIKDK